MKAKRILQIFLGGIFVTTALTFLIGALARGTSPLPALFPLVIGCIPIALMERQIRSLREAGERCKANVEAVAKALFDTPGAVRPGYDIEVTSGSWGKLMNETNGSEFTTDGSHDGVSVSAASHASVMGRQIGELHHTYSHVVVDVLGLERPFFLGKERVSSKIAAVIGVMKDASIGVAAFDKAFIINTDEGFAKAILDESIQKRLLDLQQKVHLVSTDMGVGGMSLLLTKKGLSLRWPGDLTPDLAKYIRDLLIDLRANMLAFENKKAATAAAGAGAGYRIAADDAETAPVAEEETPEEQEQAARS